MSAMAESGVLVKVIEVLVAAEDAQSDVDLARGVAGCMQRIRHGCLYFCCLMKTGQNTLLGLVKNRSRKPDRVVMLNH